MDEEKQYYALGAKKSPRDKRDFKLASIQLPVELPKQFELPELFPPKNQWRRGSCVSQGSSHHKERQEKKRISARFIMALAKQLEGNIEYGAYGRSAFKVLKERGSCEDSLYPEPDSSMTWEEYIDVSKIPLENFANASIYKIGSYWSPEVSPEGIKQAIYQNPDNSVVIIMEWFKEFNTPLINGVLPEPINSGGGHMVEVCGWDDQKANGSLKLKQSWGKNWGVNGYCWLPYSYFKKKIIWDAWISLDLPDKFSVDERYGFVRTWQKYMQEKAMAFNPWLYGKIKRLPNNREISALVYGKHDYSTIFEGKNGKVWLEKTKPQLIKEGFDYKI
jgi:hypothetical protein